MTSQEGARYRLRLARESLENSRAEFAQLRWDKVGLDAQVSTENSAKAVLLSYGRPNKTHDPWKQLGSLLEITEDDRTKQKIERLTELARLMGSVEHVLATYGDEVAQRTPKDIYDEEKARNALAIAEEAARLAAELTGA